MGLKTLLNSQQEFEVVGEAGNGEEALRVVREQQPDVVLMDLRMPVLDGVQATRRLHEILPNCHVLVLTTFDDDENLFEGLRAGAVGYLLKDASPEVLFDAIRAASRGESVLQPAIAARVVSEFARLANQTPVFVEPLVEPLTRRELEILRMVATGAKNNQIADHFVISEGTVKNHLTHIFQKLDVVDRTQAVLKARDLRII
jgi:DNA-binding NarL/FixJ family response regulator